MLNFVQDCVLNTAGLNRRAGQATVSQMIKY